MSKILAYLKTKSFRRTLITAAGVLFVLFLTVYYGLKSYTRHGESIEVPALKGLHISEAIGILKAAKLRYDLDSIYQMDQRPGLVIEQEPEARSHVKTKRTIYLTVITQIAPEVAFPNIIDKTYIEASAMLRNQSLKIADTVYVADIARDVVLGVEMSGKSIAAGQMIAKGSQVRLVLGNGRGANEVEVPNLIGLSLEEADFALKGLNLQLGSVVFLDEGEHSSTARIIRQQPETGIVSIHTAVNVTLSD